MNFDELYEKYKNGSASPEERAYVEEEIAKARRLSSILDEIDAKRVVETADRETVRRARKRFDKRMTVKIVSIVVACLLLVFTVTSASIFGIAASAAKNAQEYDISSASDRALKCVSDYLHASGDLAVSDFDRELDVKFPKLKDSIYIYNITVSNSKNGIDYEIEVNSVTGASRLVDIDN